MLISFHRMDISVDLDRKIAHGVGGAGVDIAEFHVGDAPSVGIRGDEHLAADQLGATEAAFGAAFLPASHNRGGGTV